MPTFVLMTRLAPESLHDAEVRRAMGRAWLKKVKGACPDSPPEPADISDSDTETESRLLPGDHATESS